jgi:protein-L-isoaspartate(D-aspartate) O-methyltransferase
MATHDSDRTQRIKALLKEINAGGVRNERVLMAIAAINREQFVPDRMIHHAWENRALPIDEGQTISQPLIVGLMTQALRLTGDEHILEVGTGSGYQAAILARLARSVVSIERFPKLADQARERLRRLGIDNVEIVVGDGTAGWPDRAPYDGIIVTAAAPHLPGPLLEQLRQIDGARIVIPIGSAEDQSLIAYERTGDRLKERSLGPVRFVPLVGKYGWQMNT